MQTLDLPESMWESRKVIGGVGRTLRWHFVTGSPNANGPRELLFARIEDTDAFLRTVQGVSEDVATIKDLPKYEAEEDEKGALGWCASVLVYQPFLMYNVQLHMTSAVRCEAMIADDDIETTYMIGVERLDRSSFTFWNQSATSASPKQSSYKWIMDWVPDEWRQLPFTWEQLACNFGCAEGLPQPLSLYVRKQLGEEVGDIPVTSALSLEQCRQLISAHYVLRFLAHDAELVRKASETMHCYMLHGYTSRLFGPYKQLARHVGHGRTFRLFKNLSQYKPENLSVQVLNDVYQPDGTLKARGNRPSRSKKNMASSGRVMKQSERYASAMWLPKRSIARYAPLE